MHNADNRSTHKATATLLIAEPLLFFAAFAVLASAINWPASLGLPYNEVLPLIAGRLDEVRAGYGLYFASSLLTAPLAIALLLTATEEGARLRLGLCLAALFMVFAAIFKMLGIARWLLAMPLLAELHLGGGTTGGSAVQASFVALNEYAGGTLGELFGVGLFSGLWMLLLAAAVRSAHPLAALLLAIGGAASLIIVPNEFAPFLDTAILQAVGRTVSMLGQIWLAIGLLRGKPLLG